MFLALTTVEKDKNLQKKRTLGNFSDTLHNFKKVGKNVAGSRTFEKKVHRNVAVYVGKNARLKNVACFRNE